MVIKTHDRLIEYFITVGFGGKPILNESTFRPIRDVRILTIGVNKITCVEESWSLLEYTLTGKKYSVHSSRRKSAILAVSRESSKLPITSIRFQKRCQWRAEPTWEACPTILVDSSGDEFLLVFTRDPRMPPIAEICIIKSKSESCPAPFIEQGMEVNGLRICVKLTPSCGLDCRYHTKILDRYPRQDHVGNPLLDSISSFCQPEGAQIVQMTEFNVFLPKFFTFVLTDMDGRQMYAACLKIYQKILNQDATHAQESLREILRPFWNEQQLPIVMEHESYFAPLSIALLSYYPFYEHFRDSLNEIYSISISKNGKVPIERYIANLVGETPVPEIGRTVTLRMTWKDIMFCRPVRNDFPLIDVDLQVLFRSLRIEGVLDVLSLLLMEEKVIIYSEYISLLTPVFEALRALLVPFQWEFTYVPVLPYVCRDLLDAPFPLWIGMHRSRMHPTWFLPCKRVCVVDLDTGNITYPKRVCPPNIPSALKRQLLINLKKANCDVIEVFVRETMEKNELAMRLPDVVTTRKSMVFSKRGCLSAFLTFWVALLGPKLKDYLLFPEITGSSTNNLNELFSSDLYLESRPRGYRKFLNMLMLATTFHRLIEDLTFPCKPARQAVIDFFNGSVDYAVKMDIQPVSWFTVPYKMGLQRLSEKLTSKIPRCLTTYRVPPVDTSNIPEYFSMEVDYSIGFPQLRDEYFNPAKKVANTTSLSPKRHFLNHGSDSYFSPHNDISLLRPVLFGVPENKLDFVKYMLLQVYTTWFLLFWITLDFRSDLDHAMQQMFKVLNQIQPCPGDDRELVPTEEIYKICLVVCGKLSRSSEAQRVFHEMKKFGVRPSSQTYGAYTSAISSSAMAPQPRRPSWTKKRDNFKQEQSPKFDRNTPELMKSKSYFPESKNVICKSAGVLKSSSAVVLNKFVGQRGVSLGVTKSEISKKRIVHIRETKSERSVLREIKSAPPRINSPPAKEIKPLNIWRTTCSWPSYNDCASEKNNSANKDNLNSVSNSERAEGIMTDGEIQGNSERYDAVSVEISSQNRNMPVDKVTSNPKEALGKFAGEFINQGAQLKLLLGNAAQKTSLPDALKNSNKSTVKDDSGDKVERNLIISNLGSVKLSHQHHPFLSESDKCNGDKGVNLKAKSSLNYGSTEGEDSFKAPNTVERSLKMESKADKSQLKERELERHSEVLLENQEKHQECLKQGEIVIANNCSKKNKTQELDGFLQDKQNSSPALESKTLVGNLVATEDTISRTISSAGLKRMGSQEVIVNVEKVRERSDALTKNDGLQNELSAQEILFHTSSSTTAACDVPLVEEVAKRRDISSCKSYTLKPGAGSVEEVQLTEGHNPKPKKSRKRNLRISLGYRAATAVSSAKIHREFTMPCPSCPLSPARKDMILPEEIVKWDTLEIQVVHNCSNCKARLDENSILNGHDHSAANTVECIWCKSKFTPYMEVWYGVYNGCKGERAKIRVALWKPLVLRKEMHIALALYRKDLFHPTNFRKKHPELFWNCLWFFWSQGLPLESLVGQDCAEQVFIRFTNRDPRMEYPIDEETLRQQIIPVKDWLLEANLENALTVCEVHRENSSKTWLWSKLPLWELMNELNAESQFRNREEYEVEFKKAAENLGLEDRPKSVSTIFEQIFNHPRATSRLSKYALSKKKI